MAKRLGLLAMTNAEKQKAWRDRQREKKRRAAQPTTNLSALLPKDRNHVDDSNDNNETVTVTKFTSPIA